MVNKKNVVYYEGVNPDLKESSILEYNNKTREPYQKLGFETPDTLDFQERNFISRLGDDPTGKFKPEVTRTVTKIVRVKAPDYDTPNLATKEYIYWFENWYANDWSGKKIAPVTDHIEGKFEEQDTENVVQSNRIIGKKRSGQHTVYYVPFSKEKVDEVIAGSMKSNKDTILFTFVYDPIISIELPYELFTKCSFDDLERIVLAPSAKMEINKQLEELRVNQSKNKKQ